MICGSRNCPKLLGFHNDIDCCEQIKPGHWDYCSVQNKCGRNEGDCDDASQCKGYLMCGKCPDHLKFDKEVDCCVKPKSGQPGDFFYCSKENKCAKNEGNCYYKDDQCQTGLICESCPSYVGFPSYYDCCISKYNTGKAQPKLYPKMKTMFL